MTYRSGDLFEGLKAFISAHGVVVRLKEMDLEKPGVFDGPTITIKVFNELRDAKKRKGSRLEDALKAWRLFEQASSDHAVWVLDRAGHAEAIAPYNVFFRADIVARFIPVRIEKQEVLQERD